MALPYSPGLRPSEVAFVCEMELVTVLPRQRLESIHLLAGPTPALRPPMRCDVPLWLALLLKKQRRANIVPPPWLHPESLRGLLQYETKTDTEAWVPPPPPPVRADGRGAAQRLGASNTAGEAPLSPPFLPSCTADAPSGALPYHWLELAEMLLAYAAEDVFPASDVRSLLRDLQEVRAAKMRSSTATLEDDGSGVVSLRGLGAMELAENRSFVAAFTDDLRSIGTTLEASRQVAGEEIDREEEEEEEARLSDAADDGMGL